MITIRSAALHRDAQTRLGQVGYSPKKLVLIHAAIALGGSLLMTALNYLFHLQIEQTGGLSGMGLRSVLSTVQSVLELAVMVLLPFWEIGLLYAALSWANGETARFRDLTEGFRRFGAVLAYRLLSGMVFLALMFAVFNICSTLYMLTPFSNDFAEMVYPIMQPNATAEQVEALITSEYLEKLLHTMLPLLIFSGVAYAAVAVPLFYRLRLAQFVLMDGERAGAAMLQSLRLTKKNAWQLVKLDLHFWWYYLLMGLCVVISFGDALLPFLGISLPFSEDVGYFLFYLAGALCQGVLLWQCQAKVLTTYCLAYEAFLPPVKVTDI